MIKELKNKLWKDHEINKPCNISSLPELFRKQGRIYQFNYLLTKHQAKNIANGLPIDKPVILATFINELHKDIRQKYSTTIILVPLSFHDVMSLCNHYGLRFNPKKCPALYYLKAVSKNI